MKSEPEGLRCRFNSSYSPLSRHLCWVLLQSFWPIAPAFHARRLGRLRIWTDGLEVTAIATRASMAWSDIQHAVLIQPLIPVGMGVEFQVPGKARVTFWGSRADCLRALELCEANGVSVKRRRELRV